MTNVSIRTRKMAAARKRSIAAQRARARELRRDAADTINRFYRRAMVSHGPQALLDLFKLFRRNVPYRPFNLMMIGIQRPGATYIGTENFWRDKQRMLNVDAKPILILRPYGPVTLVYDLSDTSDELGRPFSDDEVLNRFRPRGRDATKLLWKLREKAFTEDNINIEDERLGSSSAGYAGRSPGPTGHHWFVTHQSVI
jgi:hypothetical protein